MRVICCLAFLLLASRTATPQPDLTDGPQQRIQATFDWYESYLGDYLDPAAWDIGRVPNNSKQFTYDVRFPDRNSVSSDVVEFPPGSFVRIGTLDVRDTIMHLRDGAVLRIVDPSPHLSGRFRAEAGSSLLIDSWETTYLGSEFMIYAGATARLRGRFVAGSYPWHNNSGPVNTEPAIRVFGGTADLTQLAVIRNKPGGNSSLDITAEGLDGHPGLIDLSGGTRLGAPLDVTVKDGGTVRLRSAPPLSTVRISGDGRLEFVRPVNLGQTRVSVYNTATLAAPSITGLDGASITLDRVASAHDPQDYERHRFDASPETIRSAPDQIFQLTNIESDVRLLGTTRIEGPFSIDILEGATLQADSLETIDSLERPVPGGNQNARFSYSNTLTINESDVTLPSLELIESPVSISIGRDSTLRLPRAEFAYPSALVMQPGSVFDAPGVDSFARWSIRIRSENGQPLPAPVYPAVKNWDNASVSNESSLPIDIPVQSYLSSSISTIKGGNLSFNRLHTIRQGPVQTLVIVAARGAVVFPELERFTEIPGNVLQPVPMGESAEGPVFRPIDRRLRLEMLGDPSGSEGRIEMPRLGQLPEVLTFNLARAGRFVFGGSLHLDESDTFRLDDGTLELGGGFEITSPIFGRNLISGTRIELAGPGRSTLEALAPDRGVAPANQREIEDSMGISELVINPRSGARLVSLVDAWVNDSESEPGSESVYVFGRQVLSSASPEPLALAPGSILELGSVNLYVFDLAQLAFVHMNALIPDGENAIEYDGGLVCRTYCAADSDLDGIVTQGDLAVFVDRYLAGSPYADTNFDGRIDSADIQSFLVAFQEGC